MAIWIPGWHRHEFALKGKPYQYRHNPKGLIHTTEGSSIAGALAAYAPYPPHGIYDWRSREKLQHIALDYASYSAMDGSDDDYMIQIEFVGKAAETRHWPDEAWRNIAEDVFKPLEDLFGIPRVSIWHGFKDGQDGMVLATPNSPIRLTPQQLIDFSGWLGHQHLPSPDDHWDPGKWQIQKVFDYMEGDVSWTERMKNSEGYEDEARNFLMAAENKAQQALHMTHQIKAEVVEHRAAVEASIAEIKAAVAANPGAEPIDYDQLAKALLRNMNA